MDSLGPRSIQLRVIGQGDDRQLGNQVVIGRCWRIFRLELRRNVTNSVASASVVRIAGAA